MVPSPTAPPDKRLEFVRAGVEVNEAIQPFIELRQSPHHDRAEYLHQLRVHREAGRQRLAHQYH
jgi:hypothetical protein